jgi:hypothetical protein
VCSKLDQETNSAVHDIQHNMEQSLYRQTLQKIADWLSSTNYAAHQRDTVKRCASETGQWFLETDEFKRFRRGKNKTLFCPGIPGAGKTMLAAITIDYLSRTEVGESVGLAYIYCDYKSQADMDVSSLLAALLKQLVMSQSTVNEQISGLFDKYTRSQTEPSFEELFKALRFMLQGFYTVYIVIDALDELRDDTRRQLMVQLRELQRETDLRLMVTSRHNLEIENDLGSVPIVEIGAHYTDLRRFVQAQIYRLPRCIQRSESLQELVVERVAEAVDGMLVNLSDLAGHHLLIQVFTCSSPSQYASGKGHSKRGQARVRQFSTFSWCGPTGGAVI